MERGCNPVWCLVRLGWVSCPLMMSELRFCIAIYAIYHCNGVCREAQLLHYIKEASMIHTIEKSGKI